MKVTFLSPPPNLSGGVRVIALYADMLAARGHEVVVVAPKIVRLSSKKKIVSALKGKPKRNQSEESHYDTMKAELRYVSHGGPITDNDMPDADVVIATWWETAFMVSNLSASKGRKFYLVQHHEVHLTTSPHFAAGSYHLPLQKIAVSDWLADIMKSQYNQNDVVTVLNSVDTEMFYAAPRDKTACTTISMMYSHENFKGTDLAVAALKNVRQLHPELRVIAFGNRNPTRACPLPSDFEFHLRPAQDEIRNLYAGSDAYIFPSRIEGFGLPVLEAMACGTPVIGTRTGCGPDFIVSGKTGYLTDVNDVQGLQDSLLKLVALENTEWRSMAKNAKDKIAQYSWDDATDRLEATLLGDVSPKEIS